MTDTAVAWERIEGIISTYIDMARKELSDRWSRWPLDLAREELHEAVGALLARQVTLATQLAQAPSVWNHHVGPILLRTMVDLHITMAWVLKDPAERSRKFILYGLGQNKLNMEHRRTELKADGLNPEEDPVIKAGEIWATSQRFPFLTAVETGPWSGLSTRDMAEEADCLDLYRYAYIPFSAAVHSMWHHISRLNLRLCENPLHRYHGIPVDSGLSVEPDYLYRGAKYLEKSFDLFDKTFSFQPQVPSAFRWLVAELDRFGAEVDEAPETGKDSSHGSSP